MSELMPEVQTTPEVQSPVFTWDHLDSVLDLRAEHRKLLKSFHQLPLREGDETAPPTFADFLYSKRLEALGDIFLLVQHGYFQDQ